MSKFNVINPSNENYAAVAAQLEQNSDARFDYSGLARAYNGLEVKTIINFEYPKAKITIRSPISIVPGMFSSGSLSQ